jgi:hypothetical protein
METQRSQFVLKLMPSFTDFAFLVPMAFLFGRMDGVKTLLSDCDTGWHIRTGEWIIANRAIPLHDIFSFSKPGQPWFAWEWLSDVLMAWLNAHGGLRTVVTFAILLLGFTFALLFRLLRRKAGPITSIAVTILAAAAASIHWLARPHLFTFLFLVLFYGALEHVRDGRTKLAGIPYLAILPVATVLWANLHGGFLVGIILIGSYGVAAILEAAYAAAPEERSTRFRSAWVYFASAFGCLAASLINPYGYRLHAHMVAYLRDPWNSEHIGEFTSPTFHHPTALYFEIMLALGAIGAFRQLKLGRFAQPILMVVWAHAAFLAVRNIPLFVIIAAPPAAAALTYYSGRAQRWNVAEWLRGLAAKVTELESETNLTEIAPRWHLVSVIGILLVASVIWAPHPPRRFRAEFDPKRYPTGALATLRSEPGSRIFTHDEWGDYLIWSLYPSHRVFVDGRSDFYGDTFEDKDYLDVMKVKYGWEKTLASFGVDTILLPPDAPFAGALKESAAWHVVYDDGIALVFRHAARTEGTRVSFAETGGGNGRDREVTKTQASDRAITEHKSKT